MTDLILKHTADIIELGSLVDLVSSKGYPCEAAETEIWGLINSGKLHVTGFVRRVIRNKENHLARIYSMTVQRADG